jgi:hypothetical protein
MAGPSNILQTISMITPDSLAVLSNNLQMVKRLARDWDEDFAVKGAKIGQTINVRRPAKYSLRTGQVVDIQPQIETYSPLTFGQPIGVDTAFTTTELLFSFDDVSKRLVAPAAIRIANGIESLVYTTNAPYLYNSVGTPGTAPTTSNANLLPAQAQQKVYDNLAPVGDGKLSEFNNTGFNYLLTQSARTLFNPVKIIGEQYMKGLQGEYADAMHFVAQLVPTQTSGTVAQTGDATVTSAPTAPSESQYPLTGTLAVTVGTSGHVPNAGDVFTIAGVYGYNGEGGGALSTLQQFSVISTSGSGTTWTWTISPALQPSGPFQNVSALPATSAAITMFAPASTTFSTSWFLHRDALMFANKELELPRMAEYAEYLTDPSTGVGIRYVRAFDIRTNQMVDRFDTHVATSTAYEQLAVRIATS